MSSKQSSVVRSETHIPTTACGVSRVALATGWPAEPECHIPKMAYSVGEAVIATGLSRSSLYVAMKTGALRVRKWGRRTVILHDDLLDFLNNL
jgi:hypothetical protein